MKRVKFRTGLFLAAVASIAAVFVSCVGNSPEPAAVTVPVAELTDHGGEPAAFDIEAYTLANDNYRTALWTGRNYQLTLMTIEPGDDIGLEIHPDTEQFLRIEQGQGRVMMGDAEDRLDFVRDVKDNYAIFVPAGKWHNVVNTGDRPIKLYSIYSPVEHPRGTVQKSHADAIRDEEGE